MKQSFVNRIPCSSKALLISSLLLMVSSRSLYGQNNDDASAETKPYKEFIFPEKDTASYLAGTVLDPTTGETVSLATVSLLYKGRAFMTVLTDSNGDFKLEIDREELFDQVVIYSPGYDDTVIALNINDIGKHREIDLKEEDYSGLTLVKKVSAD
jgi:hypothetical protein